MYTKYIFVLTGPGQLFVLSPTSFHYLKPCKFCHTLVGIKPDDEPDLHPAMIEGSGPINVCGGERGGGYISYIVNAVATSAVLSGVDNIP